MAFIQVNSLIDLLANLFVITFRNILVCNIFVVKLRFFFCAFHGAKPHQLLRWFTTLRCLVIYNYQLWPIFRRLLLLFWGLVINFIFDLKCCFFICLVSLIKVIKGYFIWVICWRCPKTFWLWPLRTRLSVLLNFFKLFSLIFQVLLPVDLCIYLTLFINQPFFHQLLSANYWPL